MNEITYNLHILIYLPYNYMSIWNTCTKSTDHGIKKCHVMAGIDIWWLIWFTCAYHSLLLIAVMIVVAILIAVYLCDFVGFRWVWHRQTDTWGHDSTLPARVTYTHYCLWSITEVWLMRETISGVELRNSYLVLFPPRLPVCLWRDELANVWFLICSLLFSFPFCALTYMCKLLYAK